VDKIRLTLFFAVDQMASALASVMAKTTAGTAMSQLQGKEQIERQYYWQRKSDATVKVCQQGDIFARTT
jgi:hypothetical protein